MARPHRAWTSLCTLLCLAWLGAQPSLAYGPDRSAKLRKSIRSTLRSRASFDTGEAVGSSPRGRAALWPARGQASSSAGDGAGAEPVEQPSQTTPDGLPCATAGLSLAVKLDVRTFLTAAEADLAARGTSISDQCSREVGQGFLDAWQSQRFAHCQPDEEHPLTSSAACHSMPGKDVPFLFCSTHNAVIADSSQFAGKDIGAGTPASLRLACDASQTPMSQESQWNENNKRWFLTAAQYKAYDDISQHCPLDAANLVTHPVLFLYRYDPTNIFHFMEELVTTFTTLAMMQGEQDWSLQAGLQVVVTDAMDKGLYVEALERLSHPYPVRWLLKEPWPANTCVRQAVYNHHAGQSLLSYLGVGAPNDCPSPVLQAMASWLRALFADVVQEPPQLPLPSQLTDEAPGAAQKQARAARMLLSSQSYEGTPEQDEQRAQALRALLAEKSSGADTLSPQNKHVRDFTVLWISRQVFEKLHPLNGWQSSRILTNEDDIVVYLQQVINEWNKGSCLMQGYGATNCRVALAVFRLQTMELSNLPMVRQLAVTSRAAILVGVHGAGLAHCAFMKPNAGAVLEIKNGGTQGQYHYYNMAHWLGHLYRDLEVMGGSIPLDRLGTALRELMDQLAG